MPPIALFVLLLFQAVSFGPLFVKLAIDDTKYLDHSSCHLPTCRGSVFICTEVSTAPGCTYHYLIFCGDQIIDSNSNIRKTCANSADIFLDSFSARRLAGVERSTKLGANTSSTTVSLPWLKPSAKTRWTSVLFSSADNCGTPFS